VIDLVANLQSVQERIASAASRAGRDPAAIILVAVTKTQPLSAVQAAYDLGLRHFGENRVEEAEITASALPTDVTWHMIGHIQSRKAKRVVPLFHVVHSLDSVKLARALDRLCAGRAAPLPVLLECNVSGETSKYGFRADHWTEEIEQRRSLFAAVEEIVALPNLRLEGLMTMAPIVSDPEQARPVFARLRRLRHELAEAFPQVGWPHLSMGMTDDFEVAIEEGATMVRIGRALFAPDQPPWCTV
jgi:pyridoxal phosphate enzyme (YggS family)